MLQWYSQHSCQKSWAQLSSAPEFVPNPRALLSSSRTCCGLCYDLLTLLISRLIRNFSEPQVEAFVITDTVWIQQGVKPQDPDWGINLKVSKSMDVCYESASLMLSRGSALYRSKGKLWLMKEITKYKGRIYTSVNPSIKKMNRFGLVSTNTWNTVQEHKTRQEFFHCHAQFPRHNLICYCFVSFWLFSWQIWPCLFLLPWPPSYHTEAIAWKSAWKEVMELLSMLFWAAFAVSGCTLPREDSSCKAHRQ